MPFSASSLLPVGRLAGWVAPALALLAACSDPSGPSFGLPAGLFRMSGDEQVARVASSLPELLSVRVVDGEGRPVPGVRVNWEVTSGGGAIPESSTTDGAGEAAASWTLGTGAGEQLATASIEGFAVTFSATGEVGPPAFLVKMGGDAQNGVAGALLADSLLVDVTDSYGNPVAQVPVTWTVVAGDGSVLPELSFSGEGGRASMAWRLGASDGNEVVASLDKADVEPVTFTAYGAPRVVLFGDSNLDAGWEGRDPTSVARSYVGGRDEGNALGANDPHHPTQLAWKVEGEWSLRHGTSIRAVNHGVGGTSTGTGRHPRGAPNARQRVDGIERYRAEVLGVGFPWNGGEFGSSYPDGPVVRVQAFTPGSVDFALIGMGTNDPAWGLSNVQTRDNIRWMIRQWKGAGLLPARMMLLTLPPSPNYPERIAEINLLLQSLASEEGVVLIDLAAHVSDDGGRTWKSAAFHLEGDPMHYSEAVRQWIAEQVVVAMDGSGTE